MHVFLQGRKFLLWLALASALLALVVAALLASAVLQRQAIKESFFDSGDSLTGLVFQFDRELLRLRQALMEAQLDPAHMALDNLALRADILNSRLILLQNSPAMAPIVQEAGYPAVIAAAVAFHRKMDEALTAGSMDAQEIVALIGDIRAVEVLTQALNHASILKVAFEMEEKSGNLQRQNDLIIQLTLCQVVFLLVVSVALYLRQRQQLHERQLLEATTFQLRHNEEKLVLAANVFNHARESIVVADAQGLILEVNANFCKETRYLPDDLVAVPLRRLLCSAATPQDEVDRILQSVQANGYWSGELEQSCEDGSLYPALVSISAVLNAQQQLASYVLFFSNISALKQKQQQLEYVAHYDLLTGLPNRSLLLDRLQKAMASSARHGRSLAVVFIDLDGFKEVNDHHGHANGDQLLIGLADSMQTALRAEDTIARFGGDEFVALITGLERQQDCIAILERLLDAAASPVRVGELVLKVSASVGVTLYPDDNLSADQLVRHADQAMYIAKQSGKNQFSFFDAAREGELKAQFAKLPEIRLALERQEFELYYQPKVNMKNGVAVGLEALIRWNHPTKGLLAPGAFLPLIEDRPISVDVGKWVIATALQQIEKWAEQGIRLPVSVNVGAYHLQHEDFFDDLVQLLPPAQGRQGMLSIEILETTALSDIERIRQTMQKCQAIGVEFALDDFGTGYSSLTYLSKLPAQELKIDQSFVRRMGSDSNDLSIVEGVISLARAFHRQAVAEGVESAEEGVTLLQLGCEVAQGYFIARPMPARDFPQWLRTWRQPLSWSRQSHVSREPSVLLNALIRNAPVAVAIIDIHGVFENVNAPCCKIYGYERAELIGSNFSGLFPLHERQRVLELNRQFIQEGGELKGEWSVVRKDGTTIGVRIESVRVPGVKNAARRLVYVSETFAPATMPRPALLAHAES